MHNLNNLNELIKKAGDYHPLYGDRLATHLPMVLSALSGLGAPDEKLQTIFDKSINKLDPLGDLNNLQPVTDISQNLGDRSQYKNYLKYFFTQIERLGFETVLIKSLPILLPGIAASAFHPLIRLAYGIEAKNKKEIAIALAYWCAEFQSINLSDKLKEESLEKILFRLAPIGEEHQFSPGIIVDRVSEIGEILSADNIKIQPQEIKFSDIRTLCINAFSAKSDFTLLHTVTACHAYRIIEPFVENKEFALRQFWKAILVTYLSTGLNFKIAEQKSAPVDCDFEKLITFALNSTNAHVIKIVYSCLKEYLEYKDHLYYFVAKRAVSNEGD